MSEIEQRNPNTVKREWEGKGETDLGEEGGGEEEGEGEEGGAGGGAVDEGSEGSGEVGDEAASSSGGSAIAELFSPQISDVGGRESIWQC